MKFTTVILSALFCLNVHAAPKSDEKSDEALVAAAEQLISEGKADSEATEVKSTSSEPVVEATAKPVTELKESEIPVVLSSKKAADEKGNSIWRMVASLAVVAVTAAIGIFVSKRYAR